MLEVIKYYAECNQVINEDLLKIIENQKENVYDYFIGSYYKSIGEILDHSLGGDLRWLSSFKTVRDFEILKHQIFNKIPDFNERLCANFKEFKENRIIMDSIFLRFTDELTESDLLKTTFRLNRQGKKIERLLWKALIHLFNHQTHHRGQVSQILDELKIENDYSNMIRIDV